MGMDAYAFRVSPEMADGDFSIKKEAAPDEIQYWRRNSFIHDFMTDLYKKKGGTAKSFNCTYLRLTLEDLNELERLIEEEQLDGSPGFFFGSQDYEDYMYETVMKFIVDARMIITEEGNCVYYYSWW